MNLIYRLHLIKTMQIHERMNSEQSHNEEKSALCYLIEGKYFDFRYMDLISLRMCTIVSMFAMKWWSDQQKKGKTQEK